jgi:hypothetical protein
MAKLSKNKTKQNLFKVYSKLLKRQLIEEKFIIVSHKIST